MKQKIKRLLASLSAAAILFATAVLPDGTLDFGADITASAEETVIWEPDTSSLSALQSNFTYEDCSVNCKSGVSGFPKAFLYESSSLFYYMYGGTNTSSDKGEINVHYFSSSPIKFVKDEKYLLDLAFRTGDSYRYVENATLTLSLKAKNSSSEEIIQKIGVVDVNKNTMMSASAVQLPFVSSYGGEAYLDINFTGTINGHTYSLWLNSFKLTEGADITVADTHVLLKTEAQAPSCTTAGNIEYWYCTDCGRYFSDENAENEVTDITAQPTGHQLSEDYVSDQTGHWKVCTREDCDSPGSKFEEQSHSYDDKGVCTVCGYDSKYVSVSIEWGEMNFTYSEAEEAWDPNKHEYYEAKAAGWSCKEGENAVTVTNDGNVDVTAYFTYTQTDTSVQGKFDISSAEIAEGKSASAYLGIEGEPTDKSENGAKIGSITVTIGG